ncbi:MAG: TlpA disulfide reductase family protein [Clostridiales bacterium]|nr:TlpA disulfide reductase family protein [Clostridiales bacterium]
MKQYAKYIVLAAALIGILIAASVGYRYLSKHYEPQKAPVSRGISTTQSDDTEVSGNTKDPDSTAQTEAQNQAPDFTVLNQDGDEVHLSDSLGKPVVINFWATWCGPCRSELPAFDLLAAEYKEEVDFLMVNLTDGRRETIEGVTQFLSEEGYTFPVYFDVTYDAAIAYGVSAIPMTVFLDKDGIAVNSHIGAMDEATLRSYLAPLLEDTATP